MATPHHVLNRRRSNAQDAVTRGHHKRAVIVCSIVRFGCGAQKDRMTHMRLSIVSGAVRKLRSSTKCISRHICTSDEVKGFVRETKASHLAIESGMLDRSVVLQVDLAAKVVNICTMTRSVCSSNISTRLAQDNVFCCMCSG